MNSLKLPNALLPSTTSQTPGLSRFAWSTALVMTLSLCMAAPSYADCPAGPVGTPSDAVLSFLTASQTQLGPPSSFVAGATKEGMLIYDDAAKVLRVCNGTTWQAVDVVGAAATAAGTVAGAVQFRGGTAILAADDANFVWDDTNNRLGIGTAAPSSSLHIYGNVSAPVPLAIENAHNHLLARTRLEFKNYTVEPAYIDSGYVDYGMNIVSGRNNFGTIALKTLSGGTEQSRLFVANNGQVGIGTILPQSKLHVAGGIQLSDDAAACPGASNVKLGTLRYASNVLSVCVASGWTALATGSGGGAASGAAGYVQISDGAGGFTTSGATAGQELFWDNVNKRLGIGTATPNVNRMVHIGGAANLGTYAAPARSLLITGDGSANGLSTGVLNLTNNKSAAASNDMIGLIDFTSTGNTQKQGAQIIANLEGASGAAGFGANIVFNTRSSSDTGFYVPERMRITSTGNVGIGTTAPADKLDIVASSNFSGLRVAYTSGSPQITMVGNVLSSDEIRFEANGGTKYGRIKYFNELASTSPNSLSFDTNSAERMRIDASGNVGIGTTAPTEQLTVFNSATGGKGAALSLLRFKSGATYAGSTIYHYLQSGTTPDMLLFGVAGDSGTNTDPGILSQAKMAITAAGKVGIGTTTPASKLQVAGGIQLTDTADSCPGTSSVQLGTLKYVSDALSVCRSTGWTALATGTGATSSGAAGYVQVSDGAGGFVDSGTAAGQQFFWDNTTKRLGIGTPLPTSQLHVFGTGSSTTLGQLNTSLKLQTNTGTVNAGSEIVFRGAFSTDDAKGTYAAISTPMYNNGSGGSAGDIVLSTKSNATDTVLSERMRITRDGSVTIGTALPSAKLTIARDGEAAPLIIVHNTTTASDGRATIDFLSDRVSAQRYSLGIDTLGGATKNFELRDTTAVGAPVRMAITPSGNIGIGLSNPSYKLALAGDLHLATGSLPSIRTSDGANGIGVVNTSGLSQPIYAGGIHIGGNYAGSLPIDGQINTTGLDIILQPNLTERVRITQSGNVGIGTASPETSSLLDVASTTKGFLPPRMTTAQVNAITTPADGLLAYDIDTDTMKLRANGAWVSLGSGVGATSSGAAGYVQISDGSGGFTTSGATAGQEFVWDNAAKRLGIGTSTPLTALDVRGGATSGAGLIGIAIDENKAFGYRRGTDNYLVPVLGTTGVSGSRNILIGIDSGEFAGGYTALYAGTAERMRITPSGNVGIGTATPPDKLSVHGDNVSNPVYLSLSATSGEVGRLRLGWPGAAAGHGVIDNVLPAQIMADAAGNMILASRTNNASGLMFYTNAGTDGLERMRIDSSGNVGIGTTAPSDKLTVYDGGLTLKLANYADAQRIGFGNPARANDAAFIEYAGAGDYTGALKFGVVTTSANVAATEIMRIASNGNVGIGTATPGYLLDIRSTGTPTSVQMHLGPNSQDSGLYLSTNTSSAGPSAAILSGGAAQNSTGTGWIAKATSAILVGGYSGNVQLSANTGLTAGSSFTPSERLTILGANGNVGIGTTTPASKLQVAGGIQLADTADACPGTSSVQLGTLKYVSDALSVCRSTGWTVLATGTGATSSGAAGYVQVSDGSGGFTTSGATAGQEFVWDNTNKRLGIGTATPSKALDVATDAIFSSGKLFLGSTNGFINRTDVTNTIAFAPSLSNVAAGLSSTAMILGVSGLGTAFNLSINNASTGGVQLTGVIKAADRAGNTGAGHNLLVRGGHGSTATTGTAGGSLRLVGGDANGTGNNSGGSVYLDAGAPSASGAAGSIVLGSVLGNVGIGTASPQNTLHVAGSTKLDTGSNSDLTISD